MLGPYDQGEYRRIVGASSLVSEILGRLRRDGVYVTFQKGLEYLKRKRDQFDRAHRTDTGRIEPLWRLHITSDNKKFAFRYETTEESDLLKALEFLALDAPKFVFIDLGSGKGRPLLIAAKYGFRRIIGVEFAHDLVAIARENIRITNQRNISVIEKDAAAFQFPKDRIVLYMFNPFTDDVMEGVLQNLCKASPIELYIIYVNPSCFKLLDECGFLTKVATLSARWPIMIWKLAAG